MEVLILLAEILTIYQCVRVYRKLANLFFKFMGISLGISIVYAAFKFLRDRFIGGAFVYKNIYMIIALNTLGLAFVTAAALLALYALLVYKESGEQDAPASPLKKFFLLINFLTISPWLLILPSPYCSFTVSLPTGSLPFRRTRMSKIRW